MQTKDHRVTEHPGERIDDLQTFDALEFCRALVGEGM